MSHMRTDGRRRINSRKRRPGTFLLYCVFFAGLITIVFHTKNIYGQLADIQDNLNRIEVLQHGTESRNERTDVDAEVDYVNTIEIINVEKPLQRTPEQVLEKLNELGQSNSVIKDIYDNYSLYPENLLAALANNPEMANFTADYLARDAIAGELTNSEKEQEFPLLLQWDPRWGYQTYGTDNIGLAGCGPTCMSMMLFYLTRDEKLTPDRIASYSMENGYYVEKTGTAWALMEDMPKFYDIRVTKPKLSERSMRNALDEGKIIICAMGEGDFTVSGHFIVIYGYDEKGFKVNDPNCVARSKRRWAFDELESQIKSIWAYGK